MPTYAWLSKVVGVGHRHWSQILFTQAHLHRKSVVSKKFNRMIAVAVSKVLCIYISASHSHHVCTCNKILLYCLPTYIVATKKTTSR